MLLITDKNKTKIKQKYSPLSVDMETASIGHVCYVNKVPFITIMRFDLKTGKPIIANKTGGYSGPAIFPVALRRYI